MNTWRAWLRLELQRWLRLATVLIALAWALLSAWLVPELPQAARDALLLSHSPVGTPEALQRLLLLLLPVALGGYAQAQRIGAGLDAESAGLGAWPGSAWVRGLARWSAAGLVLALWLGLCGLLLSPGLGPLARRIYTADPEIGLLFEHGERARIALPAAPQAQSLAVRLSCVPRRSPQAELELRLLEADGSVLFQERLLLAGERSVQLPWPSANQSLEGSSGRSLELLRLGGEAGLKLASPGLVWSAPSAPARFALAALMSWLWLASLWLLAALELLRRGLASGLALAAALCSWALLGLFLGPRSGADSLALLSAFNDFEAGAAPAFPGPAAGLFGLLASAAMLLLAASLGRGSLPAAEFKP